MDAKTLEAMNAIRHQAARLGWQIDETFSPDELREALRLMCRCSLRLETAAHHLAEPGVDVEAAMKYVDGVKADIDKVVADQEKRNETH